MNKEIKKDLENGDFDKILGMKEDNFFDAKGHGAYNLEKPEDRYELAKDVSSFANAEGGLIIFGCNTEPVLSEQTEIVKAFNCFRREEFNISQYQGVIKENIHPKIDGIEIKWVADKEDKELGLGYIFIPRQKQDSKYFLIKNVVEDGNKIKNCIFGIAQRSGSSSSPFSVETLHKKLKYGMNTTSERLTIIEEKIDLLINIGLAHLHKPKQTKETIDKRIQDISKDMLEESDG